MTYGSNIMQWPRGRLDFSHGCLAMGVLNVTPDSFSDGGQFLNPGEAGDHGVRMADQGAAVIDVGGESTRPGSQPVGVDEEIGRVVPVISELCRRTTVPISVDTYKYDVAKAALDAGAVILNDITALADLRIGELAAEYEVPIVLMHMQGSPATMQNEPQYDDVVGEVLEFLTERARKAESLGVPRERILIDPGIGFGKKLQHNLDLLRNIDRFVSGDYRVLLGTSRKSFIGQITGRQDPADRIFGTAATVALCAAAGVAIVRVHDVAEMIEVLKTIDAIKG